eukprot:1196523-Prymnesium_polylepis.1
MSRARSPCAPPSAPVGSASASHQCGLGGGSAVGGPLSSSVSAPDWRASARSGPRDGRQSVANWRGSLRRMASSRLAP